MHAEEWPDRPAAVALYRSLRSAADDPQDVRALGLDEVRERLHGPGRHPRSPEVAARRLRLLEELGAVRWEASGTTGGLLRRILEGRISSELETFVAYRERYEEGRQFLSGQDNRARRGPRRQARLGKAQAWLGNARRSGDGVRGARRRRGPNGAEGAGGPQGSHSGRRRGTAGTSPRRR